MSRVLFNKVTKSFDRKVKAVDEVTMEIADREFFVIVGPSGCGKSTVLRLIAGLEEPDSGEIYIGDRLVNNIEPRERDIAMVFQNYALYPHMTVFENMAFALKLRRFPKEEITRRVLEAAQILGIADLLDRKPAALSGGQRQRVAVGRAIVRNPRVFLFDEPLSNLDAKLRVGMRAELARLHQRLETTVCYVTHDQVEAMTLGQRIGVMKDGKLLQIADPNTLYTHPVNRFVAGFIGSPPMNFLSGRIEPDPLRFIHQVFTITLPAPLAPRLSPVAHQPVILGVRPENVSLTEESGISGVVEVTEPMGYEVIAYLKVGAETLTARLSNDRAPRPGQTVHLHFDLARLHFFDPVTELALT